LNLDLKFWLFLLFFVIMFFAVVMGSLKKMLFFLWYGFLYTLIGFLVIFLLNNVIGQYTDFYLPINPFTAFITGFLGIPGICCLVALKYVVFC